MRDMQSAATTGFRREPVLGREEFLGRLIGRLPAVVWTTDADLRFTFIEGAALEPMGLRPGQLLGLPLPALSDVEEAALTPIRGALEGEPAHFEAVWRGRHFNGHVEPLRDVTGAVVGTAGFAIDQTELMQSQERLRQGQKMEAVGQLAGGIAHDMNNLLMVILSYAEFLRGHTELDEDGQRQAEEIHRAAESARSLIRQLLAFSRRQVLQPKVLDLNEVVAEHDELLRRLIGSHIEFVTKLDPELAAVEADPGQLTQVLMNLVINGRDAMQNGGRLEIETRNVTLDRPYAERAVVMPPGDYVLLAVTDTGHGMDDETRARVFEPFFTTKDPSSGSGLGLATVYGIVKQSGGYILAYSEPGIGTTFKVYLPRTPEAPRDGTRPTHADAAATRSGRVLVVEDEPVVRGVLVAMLEDAGYEVATAANGEEALSLVDDGLEADLVITDVVMPKLGGVDFAAELQQRRPELKVIYVSGYTSDAIARRGVLAEAAFLQKPFSLADLQAKLGEVLGA
jgi:two-component system, cell cycle sensor histidine kinase and response regulator CckA